MNFDSGAPAHIAVVSTPNTPCTMEDTVTVPPDWRVARHTGELDGARRVTVRERRRVLSRNLLKSTELRRDVTIRSKNVDSVVNKACVLHLAQESPQAPAVGRQRHVT